MSSTTAATTTTTKVYTNLTAAETTLHGGQEIALPVFPQPPTFTDKVEEREYLKGRLALAFRLFAKFGFDEGVAGHITLRDPVRPDHFWVNPLGRAFAQMRRSDLILVNGTGEVVDGGPNCLLNKAAYMIHHAVHAARPDVHCAAHAHSLYGRAFCALGKPLAMLTQDSCAFYQSVALYQQFNGVVLDAAEGANIARALGAGKACLLQNHGLLTVGATVEAAVFWFASLDKCCHVQLLAEAASHHEHAKTIDEADVAFTAKSVGNPTIGWFSAQPMFDVLMEEIGDAYLQ